MTKRKLFFTSVLMAFAITLMAQTLTITNPVLSPPYQVATGTAVTFEWDAYGDPPNAIFTHGQTPNVQQGLPPDPSWTQHTNFTGNPNGTYSITLNINFDTWIFGGLSGFIGWQYSNVIAIQTISAYQITANDSLICSINDSVMFTAPDSIGFTHQWYEGGTVITGATDSIFYATSAGSYFCNIDDGTSVNTTNTITISNYTASFSGALNGGQITLTADQNFNSYQWYERTQTGSLTPIAGATNNQYDAPVTSTLMYYAFEGVTASMCTVLSPERPVIDTFFTAPTIILDTTLNSQGYLCSGTPVSMTASGNAGSYTWYKDNVQSYFTGTTVNINGAYQNGTWHVDVECLNWPEILVTSNSVVVDILELIQPSITGANYYDKFCPGDIVPMILTDEGYNYTWYVHDTFGIYNNAHIISVTGGVYQHNFTHTTHVTIVGEFNGCSTDKTTKLNSYADNMISISIDNYDQQYLCTDSTVNLYVPSYQAGDYQDYQWYENISGTWTAMAGETTDTLNVTQPGEYKVTGVPIACTSVVADSYSKEVYSYLDREPYIYSSSPTLCEGDTTTLNMSGSSNWFAMQWLEADIIIGSGGYERDYVGMINNSGTGTQEVFKYSSYRVSAKHNSCPNGLKVKSNIVFITPSLHPEIVLTTPMTTGSKHIIEWDSTEHFIGCVNEPVSFTLNNTDYDSIYWYELMYMGDDDYDLGTVFSTNDTADNLMDAKWITAVVVDSTGCRGQSTPILLDSWVFLNPTIASYNNSELCNPGDSTLMHIAFAGNWDSIQWYLDGIPIPNANKDSIWGKVIGMYTVTCFPTFCPTVPHSSGVGPTVKFLYAAILENATEIYAMPELGYYTYQWFFNGDSVDAPLPNTPWIFPKDSLVDGTYTVAVSNNNCTKISNPYIWTTTGVSDITTLSFNVFPNPTLGQLTIETASPEKIQSIVFFDLQGREVYRLQRMRQQTIDISILPKGLYLMRLETTDGLIQFDRISKQ